MNKTLTTVMVRTLMPARDPARDTRRRMPRSCTSSSSRPAASRGRCAPGGRTGGRGSFASAASTSPRAHVADPKIGGHLTLPSARKLVGSLQNELASGKDVFEMHKEERRRMAAKFDAVSAATFPAWRKTSSSATCATVRASARGGRRRWCWDSTTAKVRSLQRAALAPTVIPGSLCDRWASRPVVTSPRPTCAASSTRPGRPASPAAPPGPRVRVVRASARWRVPSAACSTGCCSHRAAIDADPTASLPAAIPPGERDRVLTDDELRAVWHACDGVNPVFARVIRVMMLTGQRRGEVQGMRWDELSDDGARG